MNVLLEGGSGTDHTEEVGFRCTGVPSLGGGARDGEALCKGSEDVAALDIVSCPFEGTLATPYLVMPVCRSRTEEL